MNRKFNLIYFTDLMREGEQIQDINNKDVKVTPDTCYTFCYTSGTTGPPKGALVSHKNALSFIRSLKKLDDVGLYAEDVYASYLPLPHVMERCVALGMFNEGAHLVYCFVYVDVHLEIFLN